VVDAVGALKLVDDGLPRDEQREGEVHFLSLILVIITKELF